VFLCKSKFNLNLGFTIVCLSNEMIYKYSFKYLFIGEIVLFCITQQITYVQITYSSHQRFLLRILSFYHFKLLYGINDKRLETEVFGLKFKKSSRTCSFDKRRHLYKELSNFGFGFIEIGTLT
jgi:hypothetical protein